jgi:hypothetical protein
MATAIKALLAHLLALPITLVCLLILLAIGPWLDGYLDDREVDQ